MNLMPWLLMLAVGGSALPPSNTDLDIWEIFKVEHSKKYESQQEEMERKKIFMDNLDFVRDHNKKYLKGEVTFDLEMNKFSDMSENEFVSIMNGYKRPANWSPSGEIFQLQGEIDLPPSMDWRKKGAVTPVKNQGHCGSCWAFSATGSLEGQLFLKTKKLVSLSEQNLVDCSQAEGNHGCDGGLMDQAFKYVKINNGIDTESSYPYEARDDSCRYDPGKKGGSDRGYMDIPEGSESKLQAAVATKGPVSVAIDASHRSFQLYKSGVYYEKSCSSEDLDHGVLAVGYGNVTRGGAYWLVKNSWGTDWGMQGYIMMARNRRNMCGIASMASFPTV